MYFILYSFSVVITDKWIDEKGKPGANSSTKTIEGDFEVIYDENLLSNKKKGDKKSQQNVNINAKNK